MAIYPFRNNPVRYNYDKLDLIFRFDLYSIRSLYKNAKLMDVPFLRYIIYFVLLKPNDRIARGYAIQIEKGAFDGKLLNLSCGRVTYEGCKRLCDALRIQIQHKETCGKRVSSLYLSNNDLGDESAESLAQILEMDGCENEWLELGFENMTYDGYRKLGSVLLLNTSLKLLVLSDDGTSISYAELK